MARVVESSGCGKGVGRVINVSRSYRELHSLNALPTFCCRYRSLYQNQ
jgi:hypothetical protein